MLNTKRQDFSTGVLSRQEICYAASWYTVCTVNSSSRMFIQQKNVKETFRRLAFISLANNQLQSNNIALLISTSSLMFTFVNGKTPNMWIFCLFLLSIHCFHQSEHGRSYLRFELSFPFHILHLIGVCNWSLLRMWMSTKRPTQPHFDSASKSTDIEDSVDIMTCNFKVANDGGTETIIHYNALDLGKNNMFSIIWTISPAQKLQTHEPSPHTSIRSPRPVIQTQTPQQSTPCPWGSPQSCFHVPSAPLCLYPLVLSLPV